MDYKMAFSSARIQTIMQQKMEIEHFPSSVILSFFFIIFDTMQHDQITRFQVTCF